MTRELSVDASGGLVVLGWKRQPDGLLLNVRGQPEAVLLRCRCGRCHWIVTELFPTEGNLLVVSCHHCGTRRTFPFESLTSHKP